MLTDYLLRAPAEGGRLRLFCLHHAGGAASAFTGWDGRLGAGADVLPVQLPGRERRVGEARPRDMAALVADLTAQLGPYLRPPFALYGHSMGALVGYALAQDLQANGRPLPEKLIVGAYPAPDQHRFMADVPGMSLDDLTALLVRLGGMSDLVLGYPAWRDAAVRLFRDDLRVCHSFRPAPDRLACDVEAFAGEADVLMAPDDASGWARYTSGSFRLHRVQGGHFFPQDDPEVFFTRLRAALGLSGHGHSDDRSAGRLIVR